MTLFNQYHFRSRQSRVKLMEDSQIEAELLSNPQSVYYGPLLITMIKYKSIPCRVAFTSSSIVKVT